MLVLLITTVLILKAVNHASTQLPVAGITPMPLDNQIILPRLQLALQKETISYDDSRQFNLDKFTALHRHIFGSFPNIANQLEVEIVTQISLLFFWQGTDPTLKPIALLGRLDVVPTQSADLKRSIAKPFSDSIVTQRIYGRGTMDDKGASMATLEAVELLLVAGFKPQRSIYIAFGHDAEVGGNAGASAVAEILKQRRVQLEFVLNEGGAIMSGAIPGISNKTAMIGVAEKGYLSLQLSVETNSGHSSQPPAETAIGILSRALVQIEDNPFPTRLTDPMRLNLEYLAAELSAPIKLVVTNLWLFKSLLLAVFDRDQSLIPFIRTTGVITIFNSGVKDNVIPGSAQATINTRILPGETRQSVYARMVELVDDERVQINQIVQGSRDPSPVSDHMAVGFQLIQKTVGKTFNKPNATVYATPYLLMGGTDSRHYPDLTKNIYRFSPLDMQADEMSSLHGVNESIRVDNYLDMIRFYYRFINNLNLYDDSATELLGSG